MKPTIPQKTAPDLRHAGCFRLSEVVGRGHSSIVYAGRSDENLQEPDAAIKVFLPGGADHDQVMEMFEMESELLLSLDHPGVIRVLDSGETEEGFPYLAYEFISGVSLAEELTRRPISQRRSCEIAALVAEALGHAHQKMVYHRDIKPANIMLRQDYTPVIVDFGVALSEISYGESGELSSAGTPCYTSPEQANGMGHLVDGRSDIFSLGLIFYEMLTGVRPFPVSDIGECLRRIREHDPRPPRQINSRIHPELEQICLKCLSKRQEARYLTADDLARDLRSVLDGWDNPAPVSVPSILPKGLRSYGSEDADGFHRLLPGPRVGKLPASVHFWKERFGNASPQISVGVIFGCSGAGKSSFVKAGVLPVLKESIIVVNVDLSSRSEEKHLLKELRQACPYLPRDLGPAESVRRVVEGGILPAGRTLLVVFDQFEHWLQRDFEERNNSFLPRMLSQFDGVSAQCLIVVREDFLLKLSRLFIELNLSLSAGMNTQMIDTFDLDHASSVLEAYGRAYRRFHASENLTRSQHKFLTKSVSLLQHDRRVRPVDLALFTEMLKDREWEPATLKSVGSLDALGGRYLNEVRSRLAQDARHEKAAASLPTILEGLLPESGGRIKGAAQTPADLSGLCNLPEESVSKLMACLDREERILAPVDGGAYQLAHDVLVGSVRDWLRQERQRTFKGRVLQRRSNLADAWENGDRCEGFLPSLALWFQLLPFPANDPVEKELMRAAHRKHLVRLIVSTAAILTVGTALWTWEKRRDARDNAATLAGAATPEKIADSLDSMLRGTSKPLIIRELKRQPENLGTLLGLETLGEKQASLTKILSMASPEHLPIVANVMEHDLPAVRELAMNQSESRHLRLGAAALVGSWDNDKLWWEKERGETVGELLTECDPLEAADWVPRFQSVSRWLVPMIEDVYIRSTDPMAGMTAAVLLSSFCREDIDAMVRLVANARPFQFRYLRDHLDQSLFCSAAPSQLDSFENPESQARLILMCAVFGYPEVFERVTADSSRNPDLQSALIHGSAKYGLPKSCLWAMVSKTDATPDTKRASLIALGEYGEHSEEQIKSIRMLARSSGSPTVLSAARWLLGTLNQELPTPSPNRNSEWLVSRQGQILHRIPGTNSALGSCEVTEEEFGVFLKERSSDNKTPVTEVLRQQVRDYCNWLTGLEPGLTPCYILDKGKLITPKDWNQRTGYRLPTEWEWEQACKAGTDTSRSFGDGESHVVKYVWFAANSERRKQPTGTLRPNRLGFFDMLGNVTEMCDNSEGHRIIRGDSFATRSAVEVKWNHTFVKQKSDFHKNRGFRLARTLPDA